MVAYRIEGKDGNGPFQSRPNPIGWNTDFCNCEVCGGQSLGERHNGPQVDGIVAPNEVVPDEMYFAFTPEGLRRTICKGFLEMAFAEGYKLLEIEVPNPKVGKSGLQLGFAGAKKLREVDLDTFMEICYNRVS